VDRGRGGQGEFDGAMQHLRGHLEGLIENARRDLKAKQGLLSEAGTLAEARWGASSRGRVSRCRRRLACTTLVEGDLVLEPDDRYPVVRDLMVDLGAF
jgi:hypothetical protein